MADKFEISINEDDEFIFNLITDNGEILLQSEGYECKETCINAVNEIKNKMLDSGNVQKKKAKNGFFFQITNSDNDPIAVSEKYISEQSREKGIQSVINSIATAKLLDLS